MSDCPGSGRFTRKHRCQECGQRFDRAVAPPHERSNLVLCTDPDCEVAWAYVNPLTDHWHPRPHGPEQPVDA